MRDRRPVLCLITIGLASIGLGLAPPGAHASFPGANGDVAYDGSGEIYRVNVDGSSLDQLTSNAVDDGKPSFSPDGTKIAFQRGSAIWVMDEHGGSQTRLTFTGSYSKPVWSPDGTQIAMAIAGSSGIAVMDADGTDIVRLTATGSNSDDPSWSPDGTRIVYWSARGNGPDLFTIRPDGTGEVQLTDRRADDYGPSWSPDGSMITFSRFTKESEHGDIHVMSLDGTVHDRLTRRAAYDVNPVWSPDGTQILWERCGESQGIFVMDTDGSNKTKVTSAHYGCAGSYPDWQPVPA
jgi:Tol biopolymer transport system component